MARLVRSNRSFLTTATAAAAAFALGKHSYAFAPLRSFRTSPTMSAKATRVLVPIADGCEEIETTCIQDTLVRFGAEVTVASVMGGNDLVCKMSRGIKIMADMKIDEAADQDWDLIVLPGGMPGAEHLRDSEVLDAILKKQKESNKHYAAICAAPAVVLASKGMIEEGATCYPAEGFRSKLKDPSGDRVSVTGKVTTSQGPGTALEFALELGEQLFGKEKRETIQKQMLA